MSCSKKAKRVPKPPSAKEIKKAEARAAMAAADAASDAKKADLEAKLAAKRADGAPADEIEALEAAIRAVDREKADRHNEWNMEYDPYLPLEREDLLRLMSWLEAKDLARCEAVGRYFHEAYWAKADNEEGRPGLVEQAVMETIWWDNDKIRCVSLGGITTFLHAHTQRAQAP